MGSRRNRSSNDSGGMSGGGWAALLAGAAGAAVIAGASVYGGYKIHQKMEEEKKKQREQASEDKKWLAEDEKSKSGGAHVSDGHARQDVSSRDGMNDQMSEWTIVNPLCNEDDTGALHDRLLAYHHQYVRISERDGKVANRILSEVMHLVDYQLQDHNAVLKLHYRTLKPVGSHEENTQILHPENFDFNVMFDMDSKIWQLLDCRSEAFQLQSPGLWIINRANMSSNSCRYTSFDDCTVRGNFSPYLFNSIYLAKALDVNRLSGPEYKVEMIHEEARVTLRVLCKDKTLYINLHPSTRLPKPKCDLEKEIDLVPWVAPWWRRTQHQEGQLKTDLFWRRSYADQEINLLSNPIQQQCLQILKAIRLSDPQLGMLDTYIYKTVLFHCMETEDEWSEDVLAERVIDLFKSLETFLHKRHIPHYFEHDINLLDGIDNQCLECISEKIGRLLGEQKLHTLLQY